jgi:hypothetical protein
MDMKNVIFLKKDIPNKIKKEVFYWNLFAKISPLVFAIVALILYQSGVVPIQWLIVAGTAIFVVVAVTWWFWTVNTIGHISNRVHKAETGVQEVLTDLKVIKELVRDLKNK